MLSDREEQLLQQISNLDIRIQQMKKIEEFPENVRNRLQALKKLQLEILDQEADFHQKVFSLEVEYQERYAKMNETRRQIVTGSPLVSSTDRVATDDAADQIAGIPEFWLNVFKMTPVLQTMIREADEEPLKKLIDVRSVVRNEPQPSFELIFEFEPNDFFNDRLLKKKYLMTCIPNTEKPFSYNGFEIHDTVGHAIDWKDGVNLTKLTMTDESGRKHEVTTNSFFNFFDPKKFFETDSLLSIQFLETDFEIGYYIKEQVIPRAVYFFTGEADNDLDSDSDSFDDASLGGACKPVPDKEATEKLTNSKEDIAEHDN
ncbi:nucleosome assembly protein 1-like 1-B [Malaya genurostris]|uniref:nucleosome assembly protein 1-like 1-B n=1 Tax=Malaya genurostris TaxID=325434 RepID=UPI0026F38B1C|nr:nucleosome assembly protein 1-like 1-B [Malaya genurostris]